MTNLTNTFQYKIKMKKHMTFSQYCVIIYSMLKIHVFTMCEHEGWVLYG